MADIQNLEGVAQLLPPERRERFHLVIQKYKSVPEDDDHLVMLEAMGFIALFMKELPAEISQLLDQAGKQLTEDQVESLGTQFGEILTSSLDTPSYKDLRGLVQTMRETYEKSRLENGKLLSGLGRMEGSVSKYNRLFPSIGVGFSSAFVTLLLGAIAAYFLLPRLLKPEPITLPKQMRPYAELYEQRRLDHFDQDLPDYADGELRVLMIKGDVIEAFKDGASGVVVIRKADKDPAPR